MLRYQFGSSRQLVVVVVVLGFLLPGPALANKTDVPECEVKGQITDRGLGWWSVRYPDFSPEIQLLGAPRQTSFAVDPVDPNTIFVTDRYTVMRSKDGGCTWRQVFRLSHESSNEHPFTNHFLHIESLVVPESRRAHARVYLLLAGHPDYVAYSFQNPGYSETHVLVSDNSGDNWRVADAGLTPHESIPFKAREPILAVAPSDPDVVYLAVKQTYGVGYGFPQLYRSDDAAHSWEIVYDATSAYPAIVTGESPLGIGDQLVVDPLDPNTLWTAGRSGQDLLTSSDGGKTWRPTGLFGWVDVVHQLRKPAGIVVTGDRPGCASGAGCVRISRNGGRSFTEIGTPGAGTAAVVFGRTSRDILIVEGRALLRYVPGALFNSWKQVSPPSTITHHPLVVTSLASRPVLAVRADFMIDQTGESQLAFYRGKM